MNRNWRKDWSNQTSKDWAIIRQGSGYYVVPVAQRDGNFVRLDEGANYLPLPLEQRAYPQYGPYGMYAARAKYEDTDPRPEYMVRVFYLHCEYRHCQGVDCQGHDMQQGRWTEACAQLHYRNWQQDSRVSHAQFFKDGIKISQQPEEARK